MKKILLTGATGFFGRAIIKELAPHYEIIAYGRNEATGKSLEASYPGLRFVKGDLLDKETLFFAAQRADFIIHSAARSDLRGKREEFYRDNVAGTENVIAAARKYRIRRLLFISSPSIYAKGRDSLQIREKDAPARNRLNYYIESKLLAEGRIRKAKDVPHVILRPRGLFGVGDESIIPRILRMQQGLGIPLVGGGRQLIEITCVENAAYAVRLCLEKEAALYQTYHVSNGEPMPFIRLLMLFFKEMRLRPRFLPVPGGLLFAAALLGEGIARLTKSGKEPPISLYTYYLLRYSQTLCLDKIERELGYRPRMTLAQGVAQYVRHQTN